MKPPTQLLGYMAGDATGNARTIIYCALSLLQDGPQRPGEQSDVARGAHAYVVDHQGYAPGMAPENELMDAVAVLSAWLTLTSYGDDYANRT